MLTEQETLLGTGARGRRAGGSGNPGGLLSHVAHSRRFYADEVVSGLSPANHSDSVSFRRRVHRSAKMDSDEKDSGRLVANVDRRLLSPFDLS